MGYRSASVVVSTSYQDGLVVQLLQIGKWCMALHDHALVQFKVQLATEIGSSL